MPTPKSEPHIQPTLALLLQHWAVVRSVKLVREARTAVGDLDFALVGHIADQGPTSICVEAKLAHARDLVHGLETQLPQYMEREGSRYGAYVVLWFRGAWFQRPTFGQLRGIYPPLISDPPTPADLQAALTARTMRADRRDLGRIRVFVIDVTKPPTASTA